MAASYLSAGTNSVFTLGAPCGVAGAAMVDEESLTSIGPPWPPGFPIGPHCWRMTADPVIIGKFFMSVQQAIQTVNYDFHTCGDQPSVTNYVGLPGTFA